VRTALMLGCRYQSVEMVKSEAGRIIDYRTASQIQQCSGSCQQCTVAVNRVGVYAYRTWRSSEALQSLCSFSGINIVHFILNSLSGSCVCPRAHQPLRAALINLR
jgi:hypothetical protein